MTQKFMTHTKGAMGDSRPVITINQAINELVAAKLAANRRPTYVRALKFYLKQFARGRDEHPIHAFERPEVESWFRDRIEAPVSRKTGMQLLSVLFEFSIRAGYRESNPISKMDRVSVDRHPPRILTPKEARKILTFAKRHMRWRLPQLILGLYAGIRPAEISRLYWKNVNLDRGYVIIDAAAAKTRQRRVVHLDPKAVAWLKNCQGIRSHRPIGSLCTKWKRLIERNCGIKWDQGLLRHSAASYLLAKLQDAGRVSRILGNSEGVMLTHYAELVSPEDCRRFWKCSFR